MVATLLAGCAEPRSAVEAEPGTTRVIVDADTAEALEAYRARTGD